MSAPVNTAPSPDLLRRAMFLADQHGMQFRSLEGDATHASITCRVCGWPGQPPIRFVIEKFATGPFGCPLCPPKAVAK